MFDNKPANFYYNLVLISFYSEKSNARTFLFSLQFAHRAMGTRSAFSFINRYHECIDSQRNKIKRKMASTVTPYIILSASAIGDDVCCLLNSCIAIWLHTFIWCRNRLSRCQCAMWLGRAHECHLSFVKVDFLLWFRPCHNYPKQCKRNSELRKFLT